MKIAYNWLKEYINIDLSPEETGAILTDIGLEVEGIEKIESIKGGLEGVIIGEVKSKEKHPDADKLNITTVDVGNEELLQIVCGAPNVDKGQKVIVANIGCTLYPSPEEAFKIKKSKIRGVESFGMICAEDELGLGNSHDGIMVLNNDAVVGTKAKDFFKLEEDYIIEIGLTPNRADAMGHIGVARDLAAYLNSQSEIKAELKWPSVDEFKIDNTSKNLTVEVQNKEACPRYSGVVIDDVSVKESPDWLKNRLQLLGLKPINNVVDCTNYVLHETGSPLHAFDNSIVNGKVIVKNATENQKFKTLDEVDRSLHQDDLMITNGNENMCVAGVFGGLKSGVSSETTSIFLESAYFNPVSVRKTAKRQALNTDASFRFERGIDINRVIYVLKRCALLIQEVAGGKISSDIYDIYPTKIEDFKVDFSMNRCNQLIGQNIAEEKIINILTNLDIEVLDKKEDQLLLKVPSYRVDVQREADIIEEVLRIYGYNNIELPGKLTVSVNKYPAVDQEKLQADITKLFTNLGLSEMMSNSLVSSKYLETFTGLSNNEEEVKMLNPLSSELDILRTTLVYNALNAVAHNQNRQTSDIKMFEFGKRYWKKAEKGYFEQKNLSIVLAGNKASENWINKTQAITFYTLKGLVETVFSRLGLENRIKFSATESPLFEDGLTISLDKKVVGQIGWLNSHTTKAFGVKTKVYFAELEWEKIVQKLKANNIKYKDISSSFSVRRDLSLLLDNKTSFKEIETIAFQSDKKILKNVGLFDVYEGKNLPNNKKSYAVSFTLHDEKATLTDKQIDKVMQKITSNLENKLGATLR